MSRKWLLFLFCLSILFVLAPLSRASLTLRVNESATRVWFDEQGTRVSLAVENSLGRRVDAHVRVELIDTGGAPHATAEHTNQIKPGANTITIPVAVSLSGKSATDTRELLWYRLRYWIVASVSSQFDPITGVISLSEITPDIFGLHITTPEKGHEGGPYRLRVRAAHPLTLRAVSSVNVDAEIEFYVEDADNILLKQSARTGPDGFATLNFQIPRGLQDDDGDIKVVARRGILAARVETEVDLDRSAQVLVSTDKPLYQPGQTLHIRALLFNSSRHALADRKAILEISDPEGTTAFRADLNTSRFGVASADWAIPENTRLGDYRLVVKLEPDQYDSRGSASVKISRYDLPNFTVNTKPDRAYYLPGQDAEVEVRADYLFGQPVKRGHVRVVRETEHNWNYREQKWETEEGDKYEGEVDAEGRFVARLKLSDEHEELKYQGYSRYRDLSYAAYFTDSTTNRTEQRRFDLRLTKDAIHVYIIDRSYRQPRNFPLEFYVSTSYADGTPVSCEVAISRVRGENDSDRERALQTIRTNQFGVAKSNTLALSKEAEDEASEVSLIFRARDGKGASGNHTETVSLYDTPVVRVATDKTLYRAGDSIRADVFANQPDMVLAVDVSNEGKILQSQVVHLQNGRASLTVPYRPSFDGALTIAAYLPAANGENDFVHGSRTVLYPRDRDLKLKLALNQESYRPGEEASASFLTRTSAGRAAESALGVLIFDKAVEERARTDRDFGGGYGFYSAYCYLNGCSDNLAGVTRKDLDRVDLSKPLPEGLDLVAEVLLNNYRFVPRLFQSDRYNTNPAQVFSDFIKDEIDPLKEHLEGEYKTNCAYPRDLETLRRLSLLAGIDIDELRDPWETPYRASFSAEGASDVFRLTSAGTDKRFDTTDDFTVLQVSRPYFRFTGEAINRAVARFHAHTGQFIREAMSLKTGLRQEGIDFDALRDPWGRPYQLEFAVSQTKYFVLVRSSGPDRQFLSQNDDDVLLWTAPIDYSAAVQAKIESVLAAYFRATAQIPQNDAEFNEALKRSGLTRDELRDPWGRPYYATFKQNVIYSDRVSIFSYAKYGERLKEKMEISPVTQQINYIYLRSDGQDGNQGTPDDFNVASFSRLVTEQTGNEPDPRLVPPAVGLQGSTGAITGTVTDPLGAVLPGAKVTAKNSRTTTEYFATGDDNGIYIVGNLPVGSYTVTVEAANFMRAIVTSVPVRSSSVTQVNVSLEVGGAMETVTVTAGADLTLSMTSSQLMELPISARGLVNVVTKSGSGQLSTPRLREYFPETLVWQPSLETDKQGRAQLKFKLADNITTWKMSVIGSTEDGQIGTVEKEIKAFQPFFVEHDPPRILTEGDEISLPVVVRNYLDRVQTVNLEIKPESWFALHGPATKSVDVAAGDATRGTFDFRAVASLKDGKQRITAIAADANDAIEKPVTVHPDGEEKSVTVSDIISDSGSLTLVLPETIIPNSAQAELKMYPNLMAHVAESVEAIMARPYGCGEQTISSTYPSLLILRNYKQSGQDSPLRAKAQRYLRAGYDRLLNYRDSSGGFTYWGRGEPDLALTAYALRFLSEARGLIGVDDEVISQARAWLIRQQGPDGSWGGYHSSDKLENKRRAALLTAYAARVLAMTEPKPEVQPNSNTATPKPSESLLALKRALEFLALRVEEIDEPYLIASYALAALDSTDPSHAQRAIEKLRRLAHEENGASYWSLETNTPFYGWGLAGRVETTALVVQALARAGSAAGTQADSLRQNEQLISRGLMFLLQAKDRYGVWYSTQATINVLDALLALLAQDVARATKAQPTAEIFVNGRSVKSIELPPPNRLVSPITIDLSGFIQTGTNRIEVRRARGSSPASVQAVATYYLPWHESMATQDANWRTNGASGLRLMAKFDKTESRISEEITCHVEAERIGSRGYGMMLAEIGLPPGADVDRATLDQAIKESDWGISQYDILPDRVIVYLWPRAGATKFDFKFRPRFGLNAQTAPSIVYDYYNPEARAIVAPTRFVVK